jgi:RecA/RadA recombinase
MALRRTPAKKPAKPAAKKPSSTAKKTTRKPQPKKEISVRVDPKKEFAETIKKAGIAQIAYLASDDCVTNIPGRVSTGSLALDKLLKNPHEPAEWAGFPMSRVIELYGPPHIGKSTILDQSFASVQRMGGEAVLLDTETSRDRTYTERLHVDNKRLHYIEFPPEKTHVENVLRTVEMTIKFWTEKSPETPVVIGWDALAGTATEDEMEKGIASEKNYQPGAAAKAMALAARLVTPLLKGTKIVFVILNHEYDVINTSGFGKKRETYGGHGTRHMASLRIQLYSGGEWIKGPGGIILGREVVAKLVKNRLGDAWHEARIPMIHGSGTDNVYTLFSELKRRKLIVTSGSWSAINVDGEQKSFQGWSGFKDLLLERSDLYEKLVGIYYQE